MAEKLSKQLRQPQCHRLLQEPWKCGRDCRLSSKSALILPKPQILAASGSLEEGPHSPGSQADRSSHMTESLSVESDNVQNLPLPDGLGFGSCQLGQGHTQWSNKKESGTSLVMLLIGICLPMQGTWIWSLVQETLHATEQLSPCATTPESELRAQVLQLPQPGHLEPVLHKRSHCNEKLACHS